VRGKRRVNLQKGGGWGGGGGGGGGGQFRGTRLGGRNVWKGWGQKKKKPTVEAKKTIPRNLEYFFWGGEKEAGGAGDKRKLAIKGEGGRGWGETAPQGGTGGGTPVNPSQIKNGGGGGTGAGDVHPSTGSLCESKVVGCGGRGAPAFGRVRKKRVSMRLFFLGGDTGGTTREVGGGEGGGGGRPGGWFFVPGGPGKINVKTKNKHL